LGRAVSTAVFRPLKLNSSQLWPAGVGQAEQLGGLVEGLAGGVVQGFAQDGVAANPVDPGDHGVAARDQQGQEREFRLARLQHRRQQMPFQVVHRDQSGPRGRRQPGGKGAAHQQGSDQSRAGGVGDAVDILPFQAGGVEGFRHQGVDAASMVARRQLRHHAAVFGVHRRLAVQDVRQQPALAVIDGRGGLVAGGLDAEDGARGGHGAGIVRERGKLCFTAGKHLESRSLNGGNPFLFRE